MVNNSVDEGLGFTYLCLVGDEGMIHKNYQ